jgi:hypothetical protein
MTGSFGLPAIQSRQSVLRSAIGARGRRAEDAARWTRMMQAGGSPIAGLPQ